jgi:hypothetical protein
MTKIVVLPFGGCQLNGPVSALWDSRAVTPVYKAMGWRRTPFAFTPQAALQLLEFCRGTRQIPRLIRRLCYPDYDYEPSAAARAIPDSANIVLLEPNTPVDIVYEGFTLSQQEVQKFIVTEIRDRYPQLTKAANRWKSEGLYKQNEDLRAATAAEILKVFRPQNEEDEVAAAVVRDARAHIADLAELRRGVTQVRDSVSGRFGLVLYTMQFMPDGRPISWPADFKDNLVQVAQDLDLPIFEPAEIIIEHGVQTALKDFRHYFDEFKPTAGEALLKFIRKVDAGAGFEPVPQLELLVES